MCIFLYIGDVFRVRDCILMTDLTYQGIVNMKTSSQAPSYASPKLRLTDLLTYSLTGVKCRATSVAKNIIYEWDP